MRAHDQSSPLDLALLHAHKSCRSQTAAQTVQRTKKLRVALKKRLLAANSVQTTQICSSLEDEYKTTQSFLQIIRNASCDTLFLSPLFFFISFMIA